MIKALVFDCFGVLTVDPWRAFCDALPASANVEQARELNRSYDKGLVTRQDFIDGVVAATGQTPPEIETAKGSEVAKNTQLLAYIRELSQDYKIALLSNISSNWITDEFLTTEEQSLFDELIFSHQVGLVKPDPRIFHLVCERLNVSPSEAIMIDDISWNVTGAQDEGMKGVVYVDYDSAHGEIEALLNTNQ